MARSVHSLLLALILLIRANSLISPCPSLRRNVKPLFSSVTDKVDQLLELVQHNSDETSIRQTIEELSALNSPRSDAEDDESLFKPLLGNYNVSFTLPNLPNERPVGGKWNRGPFVLESQWQHLIPKKVQNSVAQAVNMIIVRILFWRIYVILRGDAFRLSSLDRDRLSAVRNTPGGLSPRTVRADFDPPRVVLCTRQNKVLLSLSLGPTSSVFLDTTFCDNRVRIGKGSKGSRFVFVRSNDPVADEWKRLVAHKPVGKRQLVSFFGGFGLASLMGVWRCSGIFRNLSILGMLLCWPSALLAAVSTGGIEEDDPTMMEGSY
ncbi:hypothetical protein FisN_25Hh168 [Fistulifera solaris]|uniref:Plastid lipid-associated protein/fibrillin conserved domain-containing protein n=1 Tax=Fistulifera solaris TaxID=1519565 RepID=A0A1Z5JVX5_FISSO|nr:hypothetical protein FisN_25Hh168 [Fistulifera solaris]|eukprot:GAX18184.1 hypothetical protein FisN_25Hh168 [Fistulifera solaris]